MSVSVLWAKKEKQGLYWLPLQAHLSDTAEIAKLIWRRWISKNIKRTIANSINSDEKEAGRLFVFLSAAHDLGKATPVFQAKRIYGNIDLDIYIYDRLLASGLIVLEDRIKYAGYAKTPHALASQLFLENAKFLNLSETNLHKNVSFIIGAHHGKPSDTGYNDVLNAYPDNFGSDDTIWRQVQSELIKFTLNYAEYNSLSEVSNPLMNGQVLLNGLIIVADWISSNSGLFPLVPIDFDMEIDSRQRARKAWDKLRIPTAWEPLKNRYDESLYTSRFLNIKSPNEMQKAVIRAANDPFNPGVMIIEAPMGQGKTEAALVAAEIMRNKTESGGVFFALPTQATSDGIFPRLLEWMNNLELYEPQSIRLVHGKAQFNNDYNDLQIFPIYNSDNDENDDYVNDSESDSAAIVHQWFNGRKKALLANFVVGTIDQLLLMALKQKHVMLKHVGLAGKIVIIDECHAYDAYMSHYLKTALKWLGVYKVPVIILSATLPSNTRRELIGAYLGDNDISGDWVQSRSYPQITYTDGGEVKYLDVESKEKLKNVYIEYIHSDEILVKLKDLLSEGGCAGVILDTVQRAQTIADKLREQFNSDTVRLIHSRFISTDRICKEMELREILGRESFKRPKANEILIAIGTQVLEQSLDIDFDVIITDLAPMDLLLQRIGRLHRHARSRPAKLCKPLCFITGMDNDNFEKGLDSVYHKYLLNRTKKLLDDVLNEAHGAITLPNDIIGLVNKIYNDDNELSQDKILWANLINQKISLAKAFCIRDPNFSKRANIMDFLFVEKKDDSSGKKGEAAVRDIDESIEVLMIMEKDNKFFMLNGTPLPSGSLTPEQAKKISTQSINLPQILCYPNIINNVIDELKNMTIDKLSPWLDSPWLSGELFLILNHLKTVDLCGYNISYTIENGLTCMKNDIKN